MKHWSQQRQRVVIYLDDSIVAVESEQTLLTASLVIYLASYTSGLVGNVTKSRLEPAHSLKYLAWF